MLAGIKSISQKETAAGATVLKSKKAKAEVKIIAAKEISKAKIESPQKGKISLAKLQLKSNQKQSFFYLGNFGEEYKLLNITPSPQNEKRILTNRNDL